MSAIHPVMVGTAGHIDHGKSSLVRALTGVEPDRLKEEKERGLTIDLGFAPVRLSDGRLMGMVDVPGHERFVKNMVAGSTALDLAILVVAADDSVMPQTVEHLEILHLLGIRRGVIALTKIDLVDRELADLAEEEVRELVAGTVLEGAEIIRVSSVTGEGLDRFRAKLDELARATPPRSHDGAFRMAIQRVFTLAGIGRVVTGIPVSGSVAVGEEVEFLPGGGRARVRSVQAFGGEVERAVAGHSTALAVPDAKAFDVRRGIVVAQPGVYRAGRVIDVELEVLTTAPGLPHRVPIRCHVGTAEVRGVLSVLDGEVCEPGSHTVVRLLLDEPVCCGHGDRYLLRLLNPVRTVGGGTVLQISEAPGRYRRSRVAEEVRGIIAAGSDPTARVFDVASRAAVRGVSASELAAELAIEVQAAEAALASHEDLHWHARGRRAFVQEVMVAGEAHVRDSVDRMLRDKPLAASISRAALQTSKTFPPQLKDAVLDRLLEVGRARSSGAGRILFVDRLRPLGERDARDLARVVEHCEQAAFRPPSLAELGAATGIERQRLEGLVARAIDEGRLEMVGEHCYAATVVRRALLAVCANCLRHGEVLDIPELRDALGTSRKYLIPLLEHIDALGLTRLRGAERRLLASSDLFEQLRPELDGA